MKRKHNWISAALAALLVVGTMALPMVAPSAATAVAGVAGEGVSVEQISPSEWKIINQKGEFVGTLKSESRKSFTFYDAGGTYIGTILETKAWLHRLYRQRNTQVTPEEARLYLDALKAIELIN